MTSIGANESPFQCLHEFVEDAQARLPPAAWDYLVGGTETETTLRRNRQALDSIAFRPRVLRDVANVRTAHDVLGGPSRLPILLAPIGSLESFVEDGAAAAARAAERFGIPLTVSSVTAPGLEATAEANGAGRRIFQLYTRGGDDYVDDHVRRAVAAGYEAFCITVDSAAYSRRERDIAKRHIRPWRYVATGMEHQAAFAWDNVKRFKDRNRLPLILKGIATGEDAALACAHGVDVIWASNHGGRQLDHCPGSMQILPEIVQAVAGRARVVIDGGFCRGTDILKALALGADSVAIGRLYCYALAAGGTEALVRLLELLETELAIGMALLGVTTLDALNPSYLQAALPAAPPGVHSAFPLIGQYTRGQ
jgi:glycolate oxidase